MTDAKTRVVVADDDGDIRALVEIAARKAGLDVVACVGDGEAAWQSVQDLTPDMVILDVAMPGMTGLEVCKLIRDSETMSSIPVLILSAAVDDAALQAGRDAGATDYLVKPFSPRELTAWLSARPVIAQ